MIQISRAQRPCPLQASNVGLGLRRFYAIFPKYVGFLRGEMLTKQNRSLSLRGTRRSL